MRHIPIYPGMPGDYDRSSKGAQVSNLGFAGKGNQDAEQQERKLATTCFRVALGLYIYGTLFPFSFDLSPEHIARAWSEVHFYPFWDPVRGRIHSTPDILSNVLLTVPLGFFGYLRRRRTGSRREVVRWGIIALVFGAAAETLQLAIPQRGSVLTDVLSGGIGAVAGAETARLCGRQLLSLLTGRWAGPAHTWLLILLFSIAATKLGPLDLTLDVGSIRADLRHLLNDPWGLHGALQDQWLTMAQFVLLGALVGSLVRARDSLWGITPVQAVCMLLVLPWALEGGQLIIESHSPSLRDGLVDFIGAAAGLGMGLFSPTLLRPTTGALIVGAALLASGLSPYHFVPWQARASFEWVPLLEYYRNTNAAAMYDAGLGILMSGLLGALLEQSVRCAPWRIAALTAGLSAVIEVLQMVVPGRSAGTTDILMAYLGGWLGAYVGASVEDANQQARRTAD
jgi:VanZ family protein